MEIDEQLNVTQHTHYKTFKGRYIDAMPEIRIDGRIPLTVRQIAEKRLEAVASGNKQLIQDWLHNRFYTPDAVAYFGDEIKIVPNCELLINIDSHAKLEHGRLVLTEEQYKQLNGKTISYLELGGNILKPTKKGAKEHPIWQAELGDILEPYTEMIFGKDIHIRAMNLYLTCCSNQKVPFLKPIIFSEYLGCHTRYSTSDLSDVGSYLDYEEASSARLVGACDKKSDKK